MSSDPPGFDLPIRLLLAFHTLIDALHTRIAERGHPDLRPMHGFVFQAVGPDGCSTAELGRRLGVTKQAAAKTVESLERIGYLTRFPDPSDARARIVHLTPRGRDALAASAEIFDALRAEWAKTLGPERLATFEDTLRAITAQTPFRTDLPGWFT
ncbi:MarR family winged helix-turn-helix transcriptional regulator [Actinocorallia sp. A-T 12471]|uniref:MarR family winged helix-turn-helix transcriptional regulator n=1 Tax=Actinocorallia sp. A-T 12471 TaxID=3089813 RepID=UPI0029CD65BC|nr:MarR family winged helix-turn-helix transcriptional regulator [Actinocorallia sp. A-T 12471]MDX6744591.1 MarR family winged helix-turn-helix transcriptional regulator [Actinocorallia sp. A-T 12471]